MRKNYQIFSKKITRFSDLCGLQVSLFFLFFVPADFAYSGIDPDTKGRGWMAVQACDVFQESNGVVVVQAETKTAGGWVKKSDNGSGYLEWNGQQYFSKPVGGKITYKVKFNTPGIYRFVWRTKINQGNDDAEHNDTWLKFPNNSNITFFGHKGDASKVGEDLKAKRNVVFPRGSGLTPVPEGSSSEGYMKVYMNRLNWRWIAFTSDHNPHKVYVEVKQAGTYEMQMAGRSYKHAVDGMILYHLGKKGNNLSDATLDNLLKSVKDCSDIPVDTDPDPDPDSGNTAPAIAAITNQTVEEGNNLRVRFTASDADNDKINLSVVIKKGNTTLPASSYTFISRNNGKVGVIKLSTKKGDAGKLDVTVTASDGKGQSQKQFSIQIYSSGGPDPDPNPGDGNISIYLVNANNNQDIKKLENNASFGVGVVGIRAAPGIKVTKGVKFILTGGPDNIQYRNKEGEGVPYSLFGDKGVKILPWENIKGGNYKLVVEVLGTDVKKTINFKVTGGSNARIAESSSQIKTTEAPLEEQLYSDFKIARFYPNPVNEELTVEYAGRAEKEGIQLQLVSRLGVVYPLDVHSYQIEDNTIKVNMKDLNLSGGVYILKVKYLTTGKAEVFRLIKY